MKKFLSLVLALVMTMSLVTVSAGAKDFTDDSKIAYDEAVDVMSAVKVVDGYANGSFNPQATLTRGAAAKIICNLILGPTTASALTANQAPYKDVPANHTFAGYIAYCQQQGIISGYADGTFRPAATLTSYAFMKMLLGALGYDAKVEHYVGSNWSIQVAKRALQIGLDDGLKTNFVGTKPVTREEACLYAFNTLQADMVEYDNNTSVIIDGKPIVVGNSDAKAVTWKNSATKKTNIKNDEYVQFAEQYFTDLKKLATTDDFEQPCTTWTQKGLKIGEYTDSVDVSYTENVKTGKIYADLNMNQDDKSAEVFVNGVKADSVMISKNNDRKIASDSANKDLVGDGSIVNVYYDDDNNDVRICVIDVFAGEITNVDKKAASPYVKVEAKKLPAKDAAGKTVKFDNKFETEETFSEEDMVLFTYSMKANSIQDVKNVESVEGVVSKYTVGKSLTLGETTYKYNKNVAFEFDGGESHMNTKSDYVVYLDSNDLVLFVKEKAFNSGDYAFVLAVEAAADTGFTSDRAKLVTAEGKLMTVYTDDDYTDLACKIVTYRKDSNNDYVLRKAADSYANGSLTASAEKNLVDNGLLQGGSAVEMKNTAAKISITLNGYSKGIYANSESVFVVMETNSKGKTDFSVYTGIKNAPSIKGDKVDVALTLRGNVVGIMFIDATGATVTNGTKDIMFLAGKESVSDKIVDGDNNAYYLYNAVRDGEIVTVKVDAESDIVKNHKDANGVYSNVQTNNKGIVTDVDDVDSKTYETIKATGVWKLSGSYTVGLDGAKIRYTVASDAKMYRVDTDGVITKIDDVKDIYSDANAEVIALLNNTDGDLDYIFIQEVSSNPNEGAGSQSDAKVTDITYTGSEKKLTVAIEKALDHDVTVQVVIEALNNGKWVEFSTYDVTIAKDATSGDVIVGNLEGSSFRAVCGNVIRGL